MLRTLKTATIAAACAIAMAPSAFAHMENNGKIPAFDQNTLTILDERGNCVLTKWDGMGGECGAGEGTAWNIVYFGFDSAVLTAQAKEKLNALYSKVTDESSNVLRANIVGYTDEIGTNEYNYKLSERRANAVHQYLVNMGYEDSQVTEIRALGERPDTQCPTTMSRKDRIACLWEDRRVEIELEYLNTYRPIQR